MAAIVIYEEANIIAIISILISMLSVASKSFVFSIATALTLKQLFFNWLSGITDFFGLFFVVAWVFYTPKDEYLQDAFITIQNVWLYRIYSCTAPLIATLSFLCYVGFTTDEWPKSRHYNSTIGLCCARFSLLLGMTIMFVCGVIASTLSSEILTWCFPAGTLWYLGTRRYPESKLASEFYFTIIGWVNSARQHRVGSRYKGCTSYTKYQDKMMRLSSFHATMLGQADIYFEDITCQKYLQKEEETQYMNVTMKSLRRNAGSQQNADFLRCFWVLYGGIFVDVYSEWKRIWNNTGSDCKETCDQLFFTVMFGIITFVTGPIYLVSRMWTLFYPIWIVLYLYIGYDVNIWNTDRIDLFQVVMITIYLVSCGIIWILFYFNLREQYMMHHILPSSTGLTSYGFSEKKIDALLKDITNHYFGIIVVPIRRAIVMDYFGPDLGPIVLSYLPTKDEYDSGENVARVKTV